MSKQESIQSPKPKLLSIEYALTDFPLYHFYFLHYNKNNYKYQQYFANKNILIAYFFQHKQVLFKRKIFWP